MSIAELTRQSGRVKSQVTRIQTFLDDHPEMTAMEARVRLKKLEELWDAFEGVHRQIETQTPEEAAEKAAFDAEQENQRQDFEDKYYALSARALEVMEAATQARQPAQTAIIHQQQNAGGEVAQQIVIQERRNRPKLPDIKLPEFSGDFTKWLFFKNSFETTIHQDELTKIQKHHYLIGVLKGEARKVIEGFTISNENYDNAWKLLKDTYDNELMIIETHMEKLLNFPSITKDDKAESIRQWVWHVQTHISSLKTLHQPVDNWSGIIIHLAKKNLDFIKHRDWQDHIKGRTPQNMPTLDEFTAFLTQRCHTLRMLQQSRPPKTQKGKASSQKSENKSEKRSDKKVTLASSTLTSSCRICGGRHLTYRCEELSKLTTNDRKQKITEKHLCTNCFGFNHQERTSAPAPDANEAARSITRFCTKRIVKWKVLEVHWHQSQRIVPVQLQQRSPQAPFTYQKPAYKALLDRGSQVNLLTLELARKLKLSWSNDTKSITGVNRSQVKARKSVQVSINARDGNFNTEVDCLLLPSITEYVPQTKLNIDRIIVPKDTRLADPGFSEPGTINLLIGTGLYWKILIGAPRNRIEGQPSLQNTQFGWNVGGEMTSRESPSSSMCLTVINTHLSQQLERFWKQESITEAPRLTKEEAECESHFVETVRRDKTGRFIVRLPLRAKVELGRSRNPALSRLEALERKFKRQPELKQTYQEFMDDYLAKGHMSLVEDTDSLKDQEVYYIPHPAVVRPDSLSTKVRVVFDASQKTSLGTSLNDKLMPGPNLQNDSFEIMLRFRTHEYVLTADIVQMFRQVLVDPRDRKYLLILWRRCSKQPVQVHQLNTVSYGTADAPLEAMRCLRELAAQHRN